MTRWTLTKSPCSIGSRRRVIQSYFERVSNAANPAAAQEAIELGIYAPGKPL